MGECQFGSDKPSTLWLRYKVRPEKGVLGILNTTSAKGKGLQVGALHLNDSLKFGQCLTQQRLLSFPSIKHQCKRIIWELHWDSCCSVRYHL